MLDVGKVFSKRPRQNGYEALYNPSSATPVSGSPSDEGCEAQVMSTLTLE